MSCCPYEVLWGCPYEVHCDASDVGLAAILLQIDGKEAVIHYASQAFKKTEHRYSAYEKECLALMWAVDTFQHYLQLGPFSDQDRLSSISLVKD